MHNIKGFYNLNKCPQCGLYFINPQPTEKEITKHYPAHKYYSLGEIMLPRKKKLLTTLYKTYYTEKGNSLLKLLFFPLYPSVRYARIIPRGKILDIGCGAGKFLILMKSFNMECHGVEPGKFNEEYAKANDLIIKNCTFMEADYPEHYFDVITLNHVFEHSNQPTETLKKINRLLKPNGKLVIAVPQIQCLAYKIFRQHWVQLDIPRHLFSFQESTIRKYAEKTGFKIEQIRYNSIPFQFLGSLYYLKYRKKEKYLTDNNNVKNPLLNFLFYPFAFFCNALKIGDQFEVVMRKQNEADNSTC